MADDEDNFQMYGSLLEPYEDDEVPTKKAFSIEDQIATDDQGRRRFHGAFTGGFSAGFFNTVGSLEGWKPAEFKSSRSEKAARKLQKPQDFMDEEDVGQFGIAPSVVRATNDYSNTVKRNKRVLKSDGPIPGVPVLDSMLQPAKETVGIKLLKKMGWKPGQGVGPRISKTEKQRMNREHKINSGKVYGCEIPDEFRKQIQLESESSDDDIDITFAPDDYDPFIYKPKDNTFGMGYSGLDKRPILSSHINLFGPSEFKMLDHKNSKISISGQAFGVGAFEKEDEDIYAGEDMSKYDFELNSSRNKNKKKPKKEEKTKEIIIDGFLLAQNPIAVKKAFPPPVLPKNFIPKHGVRISRFEPLPETHKLFNYDRTKTIGRHDLTSEQRSKILNSSSEIFTPSSLKTKQVSNKELLLSKILDKSIEKEKIIIKEKAAKITSVLPNTSVGPFKPFLINPEKQKRYEEYLSLGKLGQQDKISDIQPASMSQQEKEHEKYEFAQASRMFKPVTGLVFDKFVTASSSEDNIDPLKVVGKSVYVHGTEEMREAAKKKMFGPLTRTIEVWRPNKLLCKRFNVPDPDISETELALSRKKKNKYSVFDYYEAHQQNKLIKEGPEPNKMEVIEKADELPPEVVEELNPALSRYSSFDNLDKIQSAEEQKPTSTSCTTNIDNLTNILLNTPSTSSSIPTVESLKSFPKQSIVTPISTPKILSLSSSPPNSSKREEKLNNPAPVTLPTDPKEKRDLFKAIFLSSSEESDSEKDEELQKKPEEKITEMKNIILEEEPKKIITITSNPRPNKGIFADLDWSKVNRNKYNSKPLTEENEEIIEDKNNEKKLNQKKENFENKKNEDENLFGPKLPTQIPKQTTDASPRKPMFTGKKSVEDSSSSVDEWMEVNSSTDKTNKKSVKKHKKHKSKHKKHKSKHKKKKHSDRH